MNNNKNNFTFNDGYDLLTVLEILVKNGTKDVNVKMDYNNEEGDIKYSIEFDKIEKIEDVSNKTESDPTLSPKQVAKSDKESPEPVILVDLLKIFKKEK